MQCIISIDANNSAFEEGPSREVARTLRALADRLEEHRLPTIRVGFDLPIHDVNGVNVGNVNIKITPQSTQEPRQ